MSAVPFTKIMQSKWTAVHPVNGEKHFLVVRIADYQRREVKLECVVTKSTQIISYADLLSGEKFVTGWG